MDTRNARAVIRNQSPVCEMNDAAQQRTEPKAPSVPQQPAARPAQPATQRPAADMSATRVSPSDRLTTSKAEEDLLDIPAFLRRQAN